MRPPTTKGTLVTLHDGRVVQAVPATWLEGAYPSCLMCVMHLNTAGCSALKDLCGSNNMQPARDDQFIFIDNTPEAMAAYVCELLGETHDDRS